MLREEEFRCFCELLLASIIGCKEETTRARQCVVILRRPDDFVDGTGHLVFSYLGHCSVFDLYHGKLASLLTANDVVHVHWADRKDVSTESNMPQEREIIHDIH